MLLDELKAYDATDLRERLRHILLNWSESEIGLRHPHGPVGIVFRDQGQADLYAGGTRKILTTSGANIDVSKIRADIAHTIILSPKTIENLFISGRTIDKDVFTGKDKTVVVDPDRVLETGFSFEDFQIVNPSTFVAPDPSGVLRLYNTTPIGDIFELKNHYTDAVERLKEELDELVELLDGTEDW